MPDKETVDKIKTDLLASCCRFQEECCEEIEKSVQEQHPNVAILCCSDSRVPPEIIFKKNLGDIFDVRVAGNVAMDSSVLFSLEYAVEHLHVDVLLILGHSGCGAIAAAEDVDHDESPVLDEIRSSFTLHKDHSVANVMRQMNMLLQRSKVIRKAVEDDRLALLGGIYHLEDGSVEFIHFS